MSQSQSDITKVLQVALESGEHDLEAGNYGLSTALRIEGMFLLTGVGGDADAATVTWTGEGPAIIVEEGATLRVERVTLRAEADQASPLIEVRGGKLILVRATLARGDGPGDGLWVRKGEVRLMDTSLQGHGGRGLVVEGGGVSSSEVQITGCGTGVEVRGGDLALTGRCQGNRRGVVVKSGAAILRGCEFEANAEVGAQIAGGEVYIYRSFFADGGVGVEVAAEATAHLEGIDFVHNGLGLRVEQGAKVDLHEINLHRNVTDHDLPASLLAEKESV